MDVEYIHSQVHQYLLKLENSKIRLRTEKPDFDELEADVDKRLKSLPASALANPNAAEEAYYYVKGRKAEKQRPAKTQGSQVLGVLPSGGSSPLAGTKPTLTKQQEKRMLQMGLSNPQDFLDIEKRRENVRKSKK